MNTALVDTYFMMLKNNKLELIERLTKSLRIAKKRKDDSWKSLFGALELEESADDFIANLKRDRKFKDKVIEL